MIKLDVLQYLIEKGPGRSEAELARAIYGERATQQMVNQDVALLIGRGSIDRKGGGGPSDPFRLFPA
jgi:hypothetical protein